MSSSESEFEFVVKEKSKKKPHLHPTKSKKFREREKEREGEKDETSDEDDFFSKGERGERRPLVGYEKDHEPSSEAGHFAPVPAKLESFTPGSERKFFADKFDCVLLDLQNPTASFPQIKELLAKGGFVLLSVVGSVGYWAGSMDAAEQLPHFLAQLKYLFGVSGVTLSAASADFAGFKVINAFLSKSKPQEMFLNEKKNAGYYAKRALAPLLGGAASVPFLFLTVEKMNGLASQIFFGGVAFGIDGVMTTFSMIDMMSTAPSNLSLPKEDLAMIRAVRASWLDKARGEAANFAKWAVPLENESLTMQNLFKIWSEMQSPEYTSSETGLALAKSFGKWTGIAGLVGYFCISFIGLKFFTISENEEIDYASKLALTSGIMFIFGYLMKMGSEINNMDFYEVVESVLRGRLPEYLNKNTMNQLAPNYFKAVVALTVALGAFSWATNWGATRQYSSKFLEESVSVLEHIFHWMGLELSNVDSDGLSAFLSGVYSTLPGVLAALAGYVSYGFNVFATKDFAVEVVLKAYVAYAIDRGWILPEVLLKATDTEEDAKNPEYRAVLGKRFSKILKHLENYKSMVALIAGLPLEDFALFLSLCKEMESKAVKDARQNLELWQELIAKLETAMPRQKAADYTLRSMPEYEGTVPAGVMYLQVEQSHDAEYSDTGVYYEPGTYRFRDEQGNYREGVLTLNGATMTKLCTRDEQTLSLLDLVNANDIRLREYIIRTDYVEFSKQTEKAKAAAAAAAKAKEEEARVKAEDPPDLVVNMHDDEERRSIDVEVAMQPIPSEAEEGEREAKRSDMSRFAVHSSLHRRRTSSTLKNDEIDPTLLLVSEEPEEKSLATRATSSMYTYFRALPSCGTVVSNVSGLCSSGLGYFSSSSSVSGEEGRSCRTRVSDALTSCTLGLRALWQGNQAGYESVDERRSLHPSHDTQSESDDELPRCC